MSYPHNGTEKKLKNMKYVLDKEFLEATVLKLALNGNRNCLIAP